ncbi:MAG: hypothetical protein QM808_01860 [Steroidobacteraceae bacterium]
MWLARPVYEFLPYAYMLVGAIMLGGAFHASLARWSTLLMLFGAVALIVGLVLWLKRRDYRTGRSEYNPRSLDD